MSTFSKTNVLWSFEKGVKKQEPFEGTALTDCTPDQLRIKIEFLESNVSLLRCECEALELHSIKLQPELFQTNEIDTSWMPYNLSTEKRQPVQKVVRNVRKMSMTSTKSTRSYSGSMYSLVKKAVNNKKITINHMIFVMEKVLMILNMDFGKHCNSLSMAKEKIKDETESITLEYSRMLQYIENYKVRSSSIHALLQRLKLRSLDYDFQCYKNIRRIIISSTIIGRGSDLSRPTHLEETSIRLAKRSENRSPIRLEIDYRLSSANGSILYTINLEAFCVPHSRHHNPCQETQVLGPGYDLLTKRIPSDRYMNFIKKHFFASDNAINEYRLRINDIINKKKLLSNTLKEMQIIREKVSDSDFMQAKLAHENLIRKERAMIVLNKEIEELRRTVRMTYCSKMYKLEQFERNLGLEVLDAEIENYRKKSLVTIIKDVDDGEMFQTHFTVPKEVLSNQIDNYMKAKLYNSESDKKIKMLEDKLERQKQTVQIYCQILNTFKLKNITL
ncbi:Hypothetical protein CINCED_3A016628 [Cinara cedri]|uniref:DUF4201 domain-containing protein n=1 Tax=Cinara cedri TaxID=506608 RepID=A0A5E4NMR5_9HEMI|nr:Hypothetical protein CINCED_3A016628 [Cinara cedri]